MRSMMRPLVAVFVGLTLLTGVIYPFVITAIAQRAFPLEANGSLVEVHGRVVGSHLLGQAFTSPGYFWSRPSATAPGSYNGAASSGSDVGPTNPALRAAVTRRVAALHTANPLNTGPVPADLVTTSGSGLDPHISPAAAAYQVARIAQARGLSEDRVRDLVAAHTEGRTFGVLGEPRVNVLELNLALDAGR